MGVHNKKGGETADNESFQTVSHKLAVVHLRFNSPSL